MITKYFLEFVMIKNKRKATTQKLILFFSKMSLWDPEAAGNAAVFLRLDDMKMLEIRNAPFEGAKAVWVPNSETGYIKAEVMGKGDKPNTTKVSVTIPEIHLNSCVGF